MKHLIAKAVFSVVFIALFSASEADSLPAVKEAHIAIPTVTVTPTPTKKPTNTPKPTSTPTPTCTPTPKLKYIGTFRATGYCPCGRCCGAGGGKHTASGTKPTANRTISTDPRVIKTGSHVFINGQEYIAEDTGSAIKGNRIDIFFKTHKEALKFGVKKIKVYRKAK